LNTTEREKKSPAEEGLLRTSQGGGVCGGGRDVEGWSYGKYGEKPRSGGKVYLTTRKENEGLANPPGKGFLIRIRRQIEEGRRNWGKDGGGLHVLS